jgi:hypothetical protein
MAKCSVEGCNNEAVARGLCSNHWRRWRKHGDVNVNLKPRLPEKCSVPGCDRKAHSRWKGGQPLCNMHYLRMMKYNSLEKKEIQLEDWAVCAVPGCDKPARSPGKGSLCEMHYYRLRRTGSLEIIEKQKETQKRSNGYTAITDKEHPLASKSGGMVYIHRKVLFDKIGWGPHKCHWCGAVVDWAPGEKTSRGALVVDRLNGKKDDNRIENLVPSCHGCNATRGLFQQWVRDHKEDALTLLEEITR